MFKILTSLIIVIIILGLLYFYRKPELGPHLLETGDDIVLGPAYGTILDIIEEIPGFMTIIIFLSPLDIHYQYCPVNGRVVSTIYDRTGQFNIANHARKSRANEKQITIFGPRNPHLGPIVVKQIAGLLVRRIENYVSPDQVVRASQPLGMIKLGSRVDIIIPKHLSIEVKPGQKIAGPNTVVARPKK